MSADFQLRDFRWNSSHIQKYIFFSLKMSHRIGSFCALLIVLSFLTEFVELEHVDLINWRTGEMQGTVAGNMMTSSAGREFHAFRGIPYAKPPVGPLRFKVRNVTN